MADILNRFVPMPGPSPARQLAAWGTALESRYLRNPVYRRLVKGLLDFSCGAGSTLLGFVVGSNGPLHNLAPMASLAAAVGLAVVAADVVAGGYRTMWRYASLPEAELITASSVLVLSGLLLARLLGVLELSPATILLTALLILFTRVGIRVLRRWQVAEAERVARIGPSAPAPPRRRLLIVGAGEHGLSISRDLTRTAPGVELVGFLDDDPAKMGAQLNGSRVVGRLSDVLAIVDQCEVTEVVVAMPSTDPSRVRAFVQQVENTGIRVRAVRGVERFVMGRDMHRSGSATLVELLDSPGLPERHIAPDGVSRRVLVTGGAGYIGSHVTRILLERGYAVRVLDRFDYGGSGIEGLDHPQLELVSGDICNTRDVSRAIRDVDGVLALAAIVGDPACNLDPEETADLNYAATKILIEACNFYGVRRLVFASSCSVYGASSDTLLSERSRLSPLSLYARTRVLSENVIFDRRGEVEPVVLRLATVFGVSPRMRFDLVVNTLTARAVVDGKITIFGGNQWRPNVHCRDAARAFVLALEAPASIVSGEVFNVGGDALNHRIDEIGEMVATVVGNVEVARKADVTDPRDYRVSFQKIRQALGFVPEMSVRAGIEEVAHAVRSDPALRRHWLPVFHNVQALQSRTTPRLHVADGSSSRRSAARTV